MRTQTANPALRADLIRRGRRVMTAAIPPAIAYTARAKANNSAYDPNRSKLAPQMISDRRLPRLQSPARVLSGPALDPYSGQLRSSQLFRSETPDSEPGCPCAGAASYLDAHFA